MYVPVMFTFKYLQFIIKLNLKSSFYKFKLKLTQHMILIITHVYIFYTSLQYIPSSQSPVCMCMCIRSLYFMLKPVPHTSQMCRLPFSCTNMCRCSLLALISPLPHTPHLYGRSPAGIFHLAYRHEQTPGQKESNSPLLFKVPKTLKQIKIIMRHIKWFSS